MKISLFSKEENLKLFLPAECFILAEHCLKLSFNKNNLHNFVICATVYKIIKWRLK
jgi:hypothetical protein